jgi:hypothetical protein
MKIVLDENSLRVACTLLVSISIETLALLKTDVEEMIELATDVQKEILENWLRVINLEILQRYIP